MDSWWSYSAGKSETEMRDGRDGQVRVKNRSGDGSSPDGREDDGGGGSGVMESQRFA